MIIESILEKPWPTYLMFNNVTVTYSGDSLGGISEWEPVPGGVVSLDTVQIDDILLARGARHTAQRLLGEHGILLVIITSGVTALHEKLI